jgi:CheY-like chemotaxis protein
VVDEWLLDRDLVTDMLNNAIQNAGRYARSQVHLQATVEDGWLLIRIEDDGPGFAIPAAALRYRPDGRPSPGRAARPQGAHGSLHLSNDASLGGARFELRLPYERLQQEALSRHRRPAAGARCLRTIAQTIGAFSVEFASNYQDAIYRIRNNTPDIILCDYMLGDGRSGQQLLEELRRFNLLPDETIFMMVTGEQSYEQVVSAVELVPDDYIIKPFRRTSWCCVLTASCRQEKFLRRLLPREAPAGIRQGAGHPEAQRNSEAGRPYRFEILRQQAEVLLASGDAKAGRSRPTATFSSDYEFPWARAGVARSLHKQNRLTEARRKSTVWSPARRTSSMPPTSRPASAWRRANTPKRSRCSTSRQENAAQLSAQALAGRSRGNLERRRRERRRAQAMADVIANDTEPDFREIQRQVAMQRIHHDEAPAGG